jgi:pantetheine-phosphate adenylyltransferase
VTARLGLYPGSFDPVHNGHVDLVQRAARLASRLLVTIADNPAKQRLFTVEERLDFLRDATGNLPNVEVTSFSGLLVDLARARGATVIFRGLRAISDFEYEFQMALMNRRLESKIETVFLMPSVDHTYLSSRLVKEVSRLGGDVTDLVPPRVAEALASRREAGG